MTSSGLCYVHVIIGLPIFIHHSTDDWVVVAKSFKDVPAIYNFCTTDILLHAMFSVNDWTVHNDSHYCFLEEKKCMGRKSHLTVKINSIAF